MIRGHGPDPSSGRPYRHNQSRPIVDDLRTWLDNQLAKVFGRSQIAESIRYPPSSCRASLSRG